ncbi:MAG TPA: DUF4337 family protein [Thermoanaerobaculia bacterium]|jgi:hypothetical protein|nr:DUF4337 family protein [Thermoanaerobaculia bacterium]
MEAHELIEQAHEAAEKSEGHGHEGGGHGKGMSKAIGMTMAVMGVLLALCSALVGSARTSLVTTMVMQTNSSLEYESLSNKYRLMQANLQQLHALLPDPKEFKATEDEVQKLMSTGAGGQAVIGKIVTLESKKLLLTVTPTHEDLMRFADFMKTYNKQQKAAKLYTESFDDKVEGFSEAAEHFEWAQLCCEIGIVLASIALLLGSRFAWFASLVPGVAGVILIVMTFMTVHTQIEQAQKKINTAKASYEKLVDEKADEAGDENLIHQIETGQ